MKTLFMLLALMLAIGTRQRTSWLDVPNIPGPVTRLPRTSGSNAHVYYHWFGPVFLCLRMPNYYALQALWHRLGHVLQHVQAGTCSLALPRVEQ